MKIENLTKAAHDAQFLLQSIRAAHRDAAQSDNLLAEDALLECIEPAANLSLRLSRILKAVEAGQ